MNARMHFLTLNTGHITMADRSEIDNHVIDVLLPIVDAEGGAIPATEDRWFLDFLFPLDEKGARRNGGAYFQIADEPGLSKRPVVQAMVGWAEPAASDGWRDFLTGYWALRATLERMQFWRDPPEKPPPLPWLIVTLTPFLATVDMETVQMFGDLERCLAWTLIESTK